MKILLSSIRLESGTDLQLALYYLKAYLLRAQGIPFRSARASAVRVEVFNEDQPLSNAFARIRSFSPRLAGFSCYLWNIEKTLRLCRMLKKHDPSLVIVLGGPEASPRARELLERERAVDVVVAGEGEETFAQLVRCLETGGELAAVKGIAFRRDGAVFVTGARSLMADLDRIPSPYLTGLVDLGAKDILDVPLETSRGCAYRCHYCYYHKNFPRVRRFPLTRVERELALIMARKPYEVYLMDATFNSDPARAKKILRACISHNRGSKLHVELKAELVDPEMARLLFKANANNIEIGIQSTDPRTLKAINRGLNRKRFAEGIRLLNRYGLFYEIQLIDALPFQTYRGLLDSLDWLYSLRPPKVNILRLSMLPGTTLRERAAEYCIEFAGTAPYRASRSNTMDAKDLEKVERLRFAIARLYDNCVFQETLFALCSGAGMRVSEVFEEWMAWEKRFKRHGSGYVEFLNQRLPDFLEYVCRRRRKPALYRALVPDLRNVLRQGRV